MTNVMTAVERLRERGQAPSSGAISLRGLARQVRPEPAGSVRALLLKVFAATAAVRPYAVILCRFKGDPPDPAREGPISKYFHEIFAPGTGGLVEYWRGASLGAVDITGSRVFDWVEIDIPRAGAGGTKGQGGPGREGLIDAAVAAVRRTGADPVRDFHKPIAVLTRDWARDDPQRPAGEPSWSADDPLKPWYRDWIDGSADSHGRVCAPPHAHSGDFVAHEMGHGLGLDHDLGPRNEAYYDPCCIMSQRNTFRHPRWGTAFGPAVCLPHLVEAGWMHPRRLYTDTGGWLDRPDGIAVPLAPISRPVVKANLGIRLSLRPRLDWDYYLEYLTPTGWNQGLPGSYLFVRRVADVAGVGRRCQYLAQIPVPDQPGVPASVLESFGNTVFEVRLTGQQPGPILMVTATKR